MWTEQLSAGNISAYSPHALGLSAHQVPCQAAAAALSASFFLGGSQANMDSDLVWSLEFPVVLM